MTVSPIASESADGRETISDYEVTEHYNPGTIDAQDFRDMEDPSMEPQQRDNDAEYASLLFDANDNLGDAITWASKNLPTDYLEVTIGRLTLETTVLLTMQ